MKRPWWLSSTARQQRYAARFMCPEWGHKPMTLGDYDGKFDKYAGAPPTCANCGQEIPK